MKPSTLSIRAKIIAVIAFLVVAMMFTGTFAFVQLRAINGSAQEIQTTLLPSVRWLSEMRIQAARYRAILRDHMLITDRKAIPEATRKKLELLVGRYL